jgi:hypothetical protein
MQQVCGTKKSSWDKDITRSKSDYRTTAKDVQDISKTMQDFPSPKRPVSEKQLLQR